MGSDPIQPTPSGYILEHYTQFYFVSLSAKAVAALILQTNYPLPPPLLLNAVSTAHFYPSLPLSPISLSLYLLLNGGTDSHLCTAHLVVPRGPPCYYQAQTVHSLLAH